MRFCLRSLIAPVGQPLWAASMVLTAALFSFGGGRWLAAYAADSAADQMEEEQPDKTNGGKKPESTLPVDKKLLKLHVDFVKQAEKLAKDYEMGKQGEKAAIVYEEILKLMPDHEKAKASLDRLRAREATAGRKLFEVAANKDWQDTGVRTIAGKPIKLAAAGEWTLNMSQQLGPEGMEIPKQLKEFKLGSLVGIIVDPAAKEQKPFYIGAGKDFVAETSGQLMVRMHDFDPGDNRGSVKLEIVGRFEGK